MEDGCRELRVELDKAFGDLISTILDARAGGKDVATDPKVIEARKKTDKALDKFCACKCVRFAREGFFTE